MRKITILLLVALCFCAGFYRPQARLTNDIFWNDTMVPAMSVRVGATAPSFLDGFGGVSGQYYLGFVHTQNDIVYFTVQLPHDYIEGTDIYPHVHCAPIATNAGQHVRFLLEYQWVNINDNYGSAGSLPMVGLFWANAEHPMAWRHFIAGFTAATDGVKSKISGTGKTISSILVCKLTRTSDHEDDTYENTVAFLGFDIHYQTDGTGSRQEYVK